MGSVTQDDLLDAIRKAISLPELGEGITSEGLSTRLGVSATTVRKMLQKLKAAGCLEVVAVRVEALSGRMVRGVGYRLKS